MRDTFGDLDQMLMLHGGVKDFQLKIAFLCACVCVCACVRACVRACVCVCVFKFKLCMFARYVEQIKHIILLLNLERFLGR